MVVVVNQSSEDAVILVFKRRLIKYSFFGIASSVTRKIDYADYRVMF